MAADDRDEGADSNDLPSQPNRLLRVGFGRLPRRGPVWIDALLAVVLSIALLYWAAINLFAPTENVTDVEFASSIAALLIGVPLLGLTVTRIWQAVEVHFSQADEDIDDRFDRVSGEHFFVKIA